ncbi:nucleotidyltransferase family protein [Bacteroides sp. 224]|uniref:nucleotidyltransferase domain-containing protein n=1 Tax=Bacteroides sp. 224 TaxID=2302936 RepID=UPI0013D46FAC|nr:nucleotidyltransferase family protein [Bacteroides sp. 224]NDV67000.1 hypothetical protein [Bacteroides sp. 224]
MTTHFFELLQSGLWNRPANASLFTEQTADWKAIIQMGQQQAVIGLLFDGMQTLPTELQPERPLLLKWVAQVARIEQANEKLNAMTTRIFTLYRSQKITPVLLKGQGVAALYPKPLHRQCGDIDIYIGKDGYAQANTLLYQAGAGQALEDSIKHTTLELQGVFIENHRIAGSLDSPFANRAFQKLVKTHLPAKSNSLPVNETDILIPDPTFNAIYLFVHAFTHFLNSGIGLRQVCDWAQVMATHQSTINRDSVNRFFSKTGLLTAVRAFGYIAVAYLGLPAEQLPFTLNNSDKQRGEELLKDILQTGNFGQHDQQVSARPQGYWAGKWHTFRRAAKRCNELRRFSPSEAFWHPLTLAKGSFIAQWLKLKNPA